MPRPDHAFTRRQLLALAAAGFASSSAQVAAARSATQDAGDTLVVEAARLFDGRSLVADGGARVVAKSGRIVAAGTAAAVPAPSGAPVLAAPGGTIIPGLIDLHFHIESDPPLALRQLAHGVTSYRDPGEWADLHQSLRDRIAREQWPGPRLFLTGPHLDGENPAYPADSVVIRDPEEARLQVHRAVDGGATAIKIYFRLPLASALAVIETCRIRGVPSTAHLEILDARVLLDAGLWGVEHITSFCTSIVGAMAAERFRQTILANNDARSDHRYALFAEADLDGPEARQLYAIVERTRPFVDATLAVFEFRETDPAPKGSTLAPARRAQGFAKMQALVHRLHRHGARIVMGGHTEVRHAGRGEAPWRELELLVASGLTTTEALAGGTSTAAAFLGSSGADLGVVRPGAHADLTVVDGNPLASISDIRRVQHVVASGRQVDRARLRDV